MRFASRACRPAGSGSVSSSSMASATGHLGDRGVLVRRRDGSGGRAARARRPAERRGRAGGRARAARRAADRHLRCRAPTSAMRASERAAQQLARPSSARRGAGSRRAVRPVPRRSALLGRPGRWTADRHQLAARPEQPCLGHLAVATAAGGCVATSAGVRSTSFVSRAPPSGSVGRGVRCPAPPPGFEPGPSEPKSEVLPLHYGGSCGRRGLAPASRYVPHGGRSASAVPAGRYTESERADRVRIPHGTWRTQVSEQAPDLGCQDRPTYEIVGYGGVG